MIGSVDAIWALSFVEKQLFDRIQRLETVSHDIASEAQQPWDNYIHSPEATAASCPALTLVLSQVSQQLLEALSLRRRGRHLGCP